MRKSATNDDVLSTREAAERLGASNAAVEEVLAVLQKFDPPGVCARNLSECLAIQLRDQLNANIVDLIRRHCRGRA